MNDLLERRIDSVSADLAWLEADVMFFGGAVLPLYMDRMEALEDEIRPTDDVDVVLGVRGRGQGSLVVSVIEAELRQHGWKHDIQPNRRNLYAYVSPSGIPVDFVFDVLLPTSDWPMRASRKPEERRLLTNRSVWIPSPAFYLVCKAEASRNPKRWGGPYDSRDLEDVAMLMVGCSSLVDSVQASQSTVRDYCRKWAAEVADQRRDYGGQAYAVLEGNWSRSVSIEVLDEVLAGLCTV